MTEKSNLILIVDDQENWREALSSVLRKDGYSVETVATLQSAKEALARGTYPLVVIDTRLVDEQPGDVGGLELLSEMRDVWRGADRPGLIVMTGYVTEGIEQLALEKYKADCFFPKNPSEGFNVDAFRMRVGQLMSRKINTFGGNDTHG